MQRTPLLVFTIAVLLAGAPIAAVAVEPLFTLADDGTTFLYRARPGDLPSGVAQMFGVPSHDLPAFLAANGISDATRVGPGFVYRIPNAAARTLIERAKNLEADDARLTHELAESQARTQTLAREAADARASAAAAEARAARSVRLERLWPVAQAAMVFLVLLAAGAVSVALAAVQRQRRAERYARSLAAELEEKRKGALLDKQESARKIVELENRLRTVEAQLGPRLLVGGRS